MASATPNIDDILASIRRLPLDDRTRLLERAAHDVTEDTPKPGVVESAAAPSLLGLMADEPELVDQVNALVYRARSTIRMRELNE